MADYSIPPDDPLSKVIAEYRRSLEQTAQMIRGLCAFALPMTDTALTPPTGSTEDNWDCECCGEQVTPSTMSGFGARHGAVIHAHCLKLEMEDR